MYSFSDEPGSVRALKRFVNSTSTNGAISAAVMLLNETQLFNDESHKLQALYSTIVYDSKDALQVFLILNMQNLLAMN